ncbi:MAG: hypothetical protein Q8P26_05220 [Candidatus Levybacteria bacterium]|nr:hypothetical protein [Candidatus Levybacteria bacterium]
MSLHVETCIQSGPNEFRATLDIPPGSKRKQIFRTGGNSVTKLMVVCSGENISTISETYMRDGKIDPSKKTETHILAPGDRPHETQINMRQGIGNKRPATVASYLFTATKTT